MSTQAFPPIIRGSPFDGMMPGDGTELDRGLGAIVLFGLVGSTLLTLTLLPALTVTQLQRKAGSVARD